MTTTGLQALLDQAGGARPSLRPALPGRFEAPLPRRADEAPTGVEAEPPWTGEVAEEVEGPLPSLAAPRRVSPAQRPAPRAAAPSPQPPPERAPAPPREPPAEPTRPLRADGPPREAPPPLPPTPPAGARAPTPPGPGGEPGAPAPPRRSAPERPPLPLSGRDREEGEERASDGSTDLPPARRRHDQSPERSTALPLALQAEGGKGVRSDAPERLPLPLALQGEGGRGVRSDAPERPPLPLALQGEGGRGVRSDAPERLPLPPSGRDREEGEERASRRGAPPVVAEGFEPGRGGGHGEPGSTPREHLAPPRTGPEGGARPPRAEAAAAPIPSPRAEGAPAETLRPPPPPRRDGATREAAGSAAPPAGSTAPPPLPPLPSPAIDDLRAGLGALERRMAALERAVASPRGGAPLPSGLAGAAPPPEATETVVQIHIGRVELRAPQTPTRPAPARAAPAGMSLESYLSRNNGGKS